MGVFKFIILALCILGTKAFLLDDAQCDGPLLVGAFNIKFFGASKMDDAFSAQYITKIVSRYDIVVILETRDSSHTALNKLWTMLNDTTPGWGMVASEPIGRTDFYKEQYVFYYKTDKAQVFGTFKDPDPQDVFEREPYSAEFQYCSVTYKQHQKVIFQALHVQPKNAYAELVALPGTIDTALKTFPSSCGLISLGDFNADCRYVSSTELQQLEIFKQGGDYQSIIPHEADTTVSTNTDCAYDRVVIKGSCIDARNGTVFNFQEAYNLTFAEAYNEISDHYPVEFYLY